MSISPGSDRDATLESDPPNFLDESASKKKRSNPDPTQYPRRRAIIAVGVTFMKRSLTS